ncbi:MAG TPA: hypothetical protein VFQ96_06945, partial [Microbacteriaceae bacterium]|nr:hypothetical protein [Microbacteriaceae bacterium]
MAERLAVLLSAGIAPAAAWRHVARSREAASAARAAMAGGDVGAALLLASREAGAAAQDAWAALAATWRVAVASGAPPATSLRALASSIRALGKVRRQAGTALAGPAATARMVLVMPAVAVVLGALLGFGTVATLVTTVPGFLCLALAVALILAAARWNRRMVRRAAPREKAPGLALDLLAVAMSGGVSVDKARRLVSRSLPARLAASRAELGAAEDILRLASAAGAPAAELLRGEAAARRLAAVVTAERDAVRLSVRLMLPLGLCVLPAFMLVGVLPLLFSILS